MVMRGHKQNRGTSEIDLWVAVAAYALGLLIIVLGTPLHAQTFEVLHAFDLEGYLLSGVTMDAQGNLYGATTGIVYKLTRRGSGWIYSELYTHGTYMLARPLIGADGSLYLTDSEGGPQNAGMVFNLRPPATFCEAADCPWEATILHRFDGGADGSLPIGITFDSTGDIYGTTEAGGAGAGVVYKLTPDQGSWTFTVVTDFFGTGIASPFDGVVIDQSGNLYGTTFSYPGQVFEVTNSGEARLIYQFSCCQNGVDAFSGLVLDSEGNLYGTTLFDGPDGNAGTVYELSPSNGGWTLNTLHGFGGNNLIDVIVGTDSLLMDAQGNLYGTNPLADGYGLVFKLAPSANGWIYTDLHDFTGGDDGCYPWDGLAMDSSGNLYGTAFSCGQYGQYGGTVWEITA
jgi:uncharacterized repeat protein (TIGR03803 family)